MAEQKHAEYNPSSLGNFEKCPGFMNREGTTPQAEKGTRIHDALEKDAIDKLAKDERPIAQMCQDYIDELIQGKLPITPDVDIREITLKIDLGGGIETFGTCDRLIIYGAHGEMLDYKSGYRFVADAKDNAQGWSYVIGAFQKYPQLATITFTFLIPNRDEVLYHTFSRDDMPGMMLRLNTIIRRAMEVSDTLTKFPDDPKALAALNPQPELCEYCGRQAYCPALAAKTLKAAALLGEGLPVPTNMIVSKDRPKDIPHLLRLAPIFEKWAETVKKEALRINLEEGLEFDGFIRQERSTPRSITSVLGAWDIAQEMGVGIEDFLLACSGIAITDLEKAVAEVAPRGEKGKAKAKLTLKLRSSDLLKPEGKYFYLREDKK